MPRSSAFHRAREKKKCARSCGQARDRPAPVSIPHTVRFPDWARKPQASPVNVRNDGAVNSGANQASIVISEAGTGSTASGSISGNPFRQQLSGHGRRLSPAIMESMPQAPDQQTRNAVTRRITAHVTAGWPRLGEPLVRHRGQYCYVAALLPGRSDPTPILRLRYQGSADHWAIGIYKASSGQYSETELPGSFGPAAGTPEQGIDDTFILYAGPRTGN
jgi:hypothetical protein